MSCRSFLVTSLLTLFILDSSLRAAESIDLFNGKDLSGWTYSLNDKSKSMEDVWSVVDGTIVCKGKPIGYLLTERSDFHDYVLSLAWRWPGKGGNSGVLVHTTTPGALGVWPKSLEVQLGSKDAGDFWVIGTTIDVENVDRRRSGRRHVNLTDNSEKPLGEWNHMEITCRDDEVLVKVNDELVNHATRCSVSSGAIALQSEGTEIHFRHIRLVPLSQDAAVE